MNFVKGDEKGEDYGLLDLPELITYYPEFFITRIEWENENEGRLSEALVSGPRRELKHILQCSFILPFKDEVPSIIRRRSKRNMPEASADDDDVSARPSTRRQKRDRFSSRSVNPVSPPEEVIDDSGEEEPSAVCEPLADGSVFCLGHLRKLLEEVRFDEVGVLELALKGS